METVCRSGMKMAAAMMPAAEMMPVTSATTAAAAPAVPTAAFGDREVRHAERCREDNGCDSQRDP